MAGQSDPSGIPGPVGVLEVVVFDEVVVLVFEVVKLVFEVVELVFEVVVVGGPRVTVMIVVTVLVHGLLVLEVTTTVVTELTVLVTTEVRETVPVRVSVRLTSEGWFVT